MQLSTLKTGKKFGYSIVPIITVLVVIGYAFLVGVLILFAGPLTPEFISGFNGPGDLWILLAFPLLMPILHSIWFNYRIIRTIFGKPALGRTPWRWNTITVVAAVSLMVLGGLYGIFTDLQHGNTNIVISLVFGSISLLFMIGLMYYPYWLKRKFPELKSDETTNVTAPMSPTSPSPPPAQAFVSNPAPPQMPVQPTSTPSPDSSPPPPPQASVPPNPAPPSDTPKPQSLE
jgi:hypothetical protein